MKRHYSRLHTNTGTNQVHPRQTGAYGPPATEASSSRSPQPASSALTCPPQRAPRHPLYSGISEDTTDVLRASSDLLFRTQIFPPNYHPPNPEHFLLDDSKAQKRSLVQVPVACGDLVYPTAYTRIKIKTNSQHRHSLELRLTP